eukprot:3105035-Pleurochrysis_carterae.AAC.1
MAPMDIMQSELDGLLAEEGYCVVSSIVRTEKWSSLDDLNAAMFNYNWPAGYRPPQLHFSVLKGARGTVPESGTSLRYTASSETLHWAKH